MELLIVYCTKVIKVKPLWAQLIERWKLMITKVKRKVKLSIAIHTTKGYII